MLLLKLQLMQNNGNWYGIVVNSDAIVVIVVVIVGYYMIITIINAN